MKKIAKLLLFLICFYEFSPAFCASNQNYCKNAPIGAEFVQHRHLYETFKKDGKMALLTTDCDVILPFKYKNIEFIDYEIVKYDDKYAILFAPKKVFTSLEDVQVVNINKTNERYAKFFIKENSKYYFLDQLGDRIFPKIEFQADKMTYLGNQNFAQKINDKFAIVNLKNKRITDCIYDDVYSENEANIFIKDNIKYVGYVKKRKIELIENPVKDKNFKVVKRGIVYKKDNKYGYVSKKHNIKNDYDLIYNPRWESANKYLFIKKDGKYALFGTKGKQKTDFIYDDIYLSNKNTKIIARVDDKKTPIARRFKGNLITVQDNISSGVSELSGGIGMLLAIATCGILLPLIAAQPTYPLRPHTPLRDEHPVDYFKN